MNNLFDELVNRNGICKSGLGVEFEKKYLTRLRKLNSFYLLNYLVIFFESFLKIRGDSLDAEVAFYNFRFKDLEEKLSHCVDTCEIVFSARNTIRSVFSKKKRIYLCGSLHKLLATMDFTNSLVKQKKFDHRIDVVARILKKSGVKYLFLNGDGLLIERLIIFAAKRAGVKSITIQDGIFFGSLGEHIHGGYADFACVWGEYFKRLYIQKGLFPEHISVIGYPYIRMLSTIKCSRDINRNKRLSTNVCFLGQPWHNYSTKLEAIAKNIFNNIFAICVRNKFACFYRAHPGENREQLLKEQINLITKDETLEETFQKYSIFVSISSTALVEASMFGKVAIQVIDNAFCQENFESLGICNAIYNDSNLESHFLKVVSKPFTREWNDDYINLDKDPVEEVIRVINKVL